MRSKKMMMNIRCRMRPNRFHSEELRSRILPMPSRLPAIGAMDDDETSHLSLARASIRSENTEIILLPYGIYALLWKTPSTRE
jgi:hypothetical protein